jgi:hypothetical protein
MRFLYFYLMKDAPDRVDAVAPDHGALAEPGAAGVSGRTICRWVWRLDHVRG